MTDEFAEKLVAASEPAAWARLEPHYPASYRSTYVRRAHRLGFEAGIEFARIALQHSVPIGVAEHEAEGQTPVQQDREGD